VAADTLDETLADYFTKETDMTEIPGELLERDASG
jgi:hypothetical protein